MSDAFFWFTMALACLVCDCCVQYVAWKDRKAWRIQADEYDKESERRHQEFMREARRWSR